jgi:DNA-directed RNA polymerase sigma subunit (sigma70/sigma32)
MPQPKKYQELYDRQAQYHQTENGKKAIAKYESSEAARERKRRWWQENRASQPRDRTQNFIDTYGDPQQALEPLSEREQQVLSLYFGLDGTQPITLEKIAQQMNLSKQRIGAIKAAVIKKLNRTSTDN